MLSKEKETEAVKVFRQALRQYSSTYATDVITCEGCQWNDNCEWAWDLYNTDDDCLAMK